jgi:hypothetical protein
LLSLLPGSVAAGSVVEEIITDPFAGSVPTSSSQ